MSSAAVFDVLWVWLWLLLLVQEVSSAPWKFYLGGQQVVKSFFLYEAGLLENSKSQSLWLSS